MANNPLKKYFRQPKVFIKLPSKGVYNAPGTLNSDPDNVAIFGMTGMDEILMKTPDALLNGEATARVIESCCPAIQDAWDVCLLDLDALLTAIRIATQGNTMSVTHQCKACDTVNDYDIELGNVIEHYNKCEYDNKIVLKDLSIKIQPLTYKQWTAFQLKNFQLQRQLKQIVDMIDQEQQSVMINAMYEQLTQIQTEALFLQIASVDIGNQVVEEKEFITEWLANCEKNIFDAVKDKIEENRIAWEIPKLTVMCDSCNTENAIAITMDQSSFFVKA
jgi:RNase P subunit RPR2